MYLKDIKGDFDLAVKALQNLFAIGPDTLQRLWIVMWLHVSSVWGPGNDIEIDSVIEQLKGLLWRNRHVCKDIMSAADWMSPLWDSAASSWLARSDEKAITLNCYHLDEQNSLHSAWPFKRSRAINHSHICLAWWMSEYKASRLKNKRRDFGADLHLNRVGLGNFALSSAIIFRSAIRCRWNIPGEVYLLPREYICRLKMSNAH